MWIACLNFPVPLPWTILAVWSFAKKQSSKNLSTIGKASSTVSPITFISEFAVLVLETFGLDFISASVKSFFIFLGNSKYLIFTLVFINPIWTWTSLFLFILEIIIPFWLRLVI